MYRKHHMCYGLQHPGYVNEGWDWKAAHSFFTNTCLEVYVMKGICFNFNICEFPRQPLKVVLGLRLCCDPNMDGVQCCDAGFGDLFVMKGISFDLNNFKHPTPSSCVGA